MQNIVRREKGPSVFLRRGMCRAASLQARFSAFRPFAFRSNSIMRRAIIVGKAINESINPMIAIIK